MTQRPQIKLELGNNPLPIVNGFARVELGYPTMDEPFGDAIVMVIIDGRDAGGWNGTFDACETWLEGFLIGRLGSADRRPSVSE